MSQVVDLRGSVLRAVKRYPVKSNAVRRSLIAEDICPECGGELDTGWECNDCGFDARDIAITIPARSG